MNITDLDFDLPSEYIAQTPVEPRDSSRLMVLDRQPRSITHHIFRDIESFLRPGDLLIANQSRVMSARLMGRKAGSGGQVEVLLLKERPDLGNDHWEALVRPGRRIQEGQKLEFDEGLEAEVISSTAAGGRVIHFHPPSGVSFRSLIERVGTVPLPPYIHTQLQDSERYQTVYASETGSAAAPTAGLHFTPELIQRIKDKGVGFTFVTLHIGLDTFRPIEEDNVQDHKMHSEEIDLDAATAEQIYQTRISGSRVIAVGTTSVRVLESIAAMQNIESRTQPIQPYHGPTSLYITPGYTYKLVDALITNFHLPRSTLLLLVGAFAGFDFMMQAYDIAKDEKYRFFSFGDAMFIS